MTLEAIDTEQPDQTPVAHDVFGVTRAEELRELTVEQLADVFAVAPSPTTLAPLHGDPAGVGIRGAIFRGSRFDRWLSRYARSERFVWHGKGFRIDADDRHGWGYNRFSIGPVLQAFPFAVSIGPSLIDGRDAVLLDFDVPRNPFWERRTWDELREVLPGVYAGPTMQRGRAGAKTLAWFCCDTTRSTPSRVVD